MKKIILYFIFIISISYCKAQNLIPNPSFEIHDTCPDAPAQLRFCTNWLNPTTTSTDYYYKCNDSSITPPFLLESVFQYPHSQNGLIGLCLIQPNNLQITYREYAQVKLTNKLQIGNRYQYNQYINCGVTHISGGDLMLASNNSGILFTTWAIKNYAPFVTFPNFCFIAQKPQINFNQVVSDTANWTLQTAEFIADSAYEYLTIGNFMPDSLTSHFGIGDTTSLGPNSYGAYYLYDDMSLIDMGKDSASGVFDIKQKSAIILYPNPFTGTLTINSSEEINQITIFDVLGKIVFEKRNVEDKSLSLKSLQCGIYTIKIISKNGVTTQKIIKE